MDNTNQNPLTDEILMGLAQLQRYLGDEMAPMMVADSIRPLLKESPEIVIPVIQDWITDQRRIEGPQLTIGDCLFHAVKCIYALSQLHLIDKQLVTEYTGGLGRLVLDLCPEDQRAQLRHTLASLGKQPQSLSRAPARVRRDVGHAREPASDDRARRQRRFSLLVDRLQQDSGAAIRTQEERSSAMASLRDQVVAASAMGARSEEEFQSYRHQLVESGIDARTEQVFRSLAQTLPGWTLPEEAEQDPREPVWARSRALNAMRRIIAGSDVREGSQRFVELVEAAIQSFNGGSLPQAHKMFRLAQGLADDGKVRPEVPKSLKARAAGSLAHDQLLGAAEDTRRRHLLRHILDFFPELQVEGLLTELATADVKERRKLLLVLLEVHGDRARPAILETLREYLENRSAETDGFMLRNLVFLLRRIPRDESETPEREIELLSRLLDPATPAFVTKEAVGAMGQIRNPRADSALRQLLSDLENQPADASSRCSDDLPALLDRTVAALARLGSPAAIQSVLQHGISQKSRSGSPFGRLGELAFTDLSRHPEVLDYLLDSFQRALPRRLFGILRIKHRDQIAVLIRALSGTTSETLFQRLGEVARRYPSEDFGEQAHEVVRDMRLRSDPRRSLGPGLAGDLDLFGVSDLLQTLAGSQRTGTLTLMDQDTVQAGVVVLREGKIASAQVGCLENRDAVYQLFERPVIGSFTFRSGDPQQEVGNSTDHDALEVIPLIMEGIRRHDELQQAVVLVPDDVLLVPGQGKPSRPGHEEDRDFLRSLWKKILAGDGPVVCEQALAVDSYRVRCTMAHWVEEGSLVPKPA